MTLTETPSLSASFVRLIGSPFSNQRADHLARRQQIIS
jgi:hypothetical protein